MINWLLKKLNLVRCESYTKLTRRVKNLVKRNKEISWMYNYLSIQNRDLYEKNFELEETVELLLEALSE